MVKNKKKPEIMDFTIDSSDFSGTSPSLPKAKPKSKSKTKSANDRLKKREPESSTTKANKRKTRHRMYDEEMLAAGYDPDEDADSQDFSSDDDGLSSTKPQPQAKAKKKKKRVAESTALVVQPVEKNKISKIDKRKVKSIVGDDADRMLSMLEDDNNLDAAVKLVKRRLLQTMIDMVPQLETSMRNSDGRYGAHALNGTIQTIRELIIDLEAAADRGAIGETLVDKVIRPAVLEIATSVVEESTAVLGEVKDLMDHDTYLRVRQAQLDSRNRLASVLNSKYETMRSEIVSYLQR